MAQVTDRNIGANPSGFDMRTEINNIIAALESDNSGTSEPLNTVAYMKWLDTSNATYYYYKERNHDNTAWVTLFRYTVATKIMEVVNNGTDLTTTLALKAPLASPTFTGTVVLPSTTSIGTITNTELGYLDGVTSSIQTQFTGKQATLVSGTNIKTINGTSILGSGNLVVSSADATSSVKGIDFKGLLAEYEVAGSPTTSIDLSGLDINAHKSYRIEVEIVGVSGGGASIYMFVNGDSTLANYYIQFTAHNNTTVVTSRQNEPRIGNIGGAGVVMQGIVDCSLIGGIFQYRASSNYLTGSTVQGYDIWGNKVATVANITSIKIVSNAANNIGIGSKIRIYRGDV